MSATVHWRRNSSDGSFGWSSGVSALWNAYRWLSNIRPGGPSAFFGSKLKMCATQSNTKASSIMTDHLALERPGAAAGRLRGLVGGYEGIPVRHLRGRRQEAQETSGPGRQPVGGPCLVPDDLDVR